MEQIQERMREYMMQEGVLHCVVPDSVNYYKAAPARVLALFVAAAVKNCAIEAQTYEAACASMELVKKVPVNAIRSAMQNILLSQRPQAIGTFVAQGVFHPFGILESTPDFRILQQVPCTMETRWWTFLRLCGASYETVCEQLQFTSAFAETLTALDDLATRKELPQNELELKMMLSTMPDFDYTAMVQTLALTDKRWEGQDILFEAIYRAKAPYRVNDLAITMGQLAVLGIREKKAEWVVRQLLDTIIQTPEMNQYPPLEMMALTLAQQYQ